MLVRQRLDAGLAQRVSFGILSPSFWSLFSRRPARVRSDDGTLYELDADFPDVLHELLRCAIGSALLHKLPAYRLYYRSDRHHPRHDPHAPGATAQNKPDRPPEQVLASPNELRAFLDQLPLPPGWPPEPDEPGAEADR